MEGPMLISLRQLQRQFPTDPIRSLIPSEEDIAVLIGGKRNTEAWRKNWKDRSGASPILQWGNNIDAVGAEMCFAKYLDVYYLPVVNDPSASDVNPRWPYEVRANCSRRLTDMILRPQDKKKEDRPFISVLSYWPHFVILGWKYGRDGMVGEPEIRGTERAPCWWVDRKDLEPLSTLPRPRKRLV